MRPIINTESLKEDMLEAFKENGLDESLMTDDMVELIVDEMLETEAILLSKFIKRYKEEK